MSFGTNWGPHDGTSDYEQFIQGITNLSQLGKGRILVKSAGDQGYNDKDPEKNDKKRIHAEGIGSSAEGIGNTTATFNVNSNPAVQNEVLFLEIWYPKDDNYSITIQAPGGREYGPFFKGQGTGEPGQGWYYKTNTDGIVYIHNEHWSQSSNDKRTFYFNTTDNYIFCAIADDNIDGTAYEMKSGTWTLKMARSSGTSNKKWDAYLLANAMDFNANFLTGFSNSKVITEPGNAKNVITVGAMNSNPINLTSDYPKNQISYFSSPGPTRDNERNIPKPEIYAPGALIASSMAEGCTPWLPSGVTSDGKHQYLAGTSMAAPFVSGAIALLLQQHPDWTYQQVLDRLVTTATTMTYSPIGSSTTTINYLLLNICMLLCNNNDICFQNPGTPSNVPSGSNLESTNKSKSFSELEKKKGGSNEK
ncbi:MAG TPA: S8 family serine peptidase [Ignavibacteriales bacterium]|nr:S8 family serine peptidase [Ignavibacteriales bacterium]